MPKELTVTEELKKMFDFFYLIKGETKKEYKRRVEKRANEILNGIDCTLEETINLRALIKCRMPIVKLGSIIIPTEADELVDKFKGNAKEYEEATFMRHFDNLDEEEFKKVKEQLWNETADKLDKETHRDYTWTYQDECLYNALNAAEEAEKEYGDLNAEEAKEKVNRKRFAHKK